MTAIQTIKGRDVSHCHVPDSPCRDREMTAADLAAAREVASHHPQAVELRPPSFDYNCHGYAYAKAHGWFNHPRRLMDDNYDVFPLDNPRVGDVVVYKHGQTLMHSAVVTRVEGGEVVELRSKWGELAVLLHDLKGVPRSYGHPEFLLRRVPAEPS
jgi:hypothetical protein